MIHGLEGHVEIGAQVIKSFGNPCQGQLGCLLYRQKATILYVIHVFIMLCLKKVSHYLAKRKKRVCSLA